MNKVEVLSSETVESVFGAGYISDAAGVVYRNTNGILAHVSNRDMQHVQTLIVEICRAVGQEAAEVGFE